MPDDRRRGHVARVLVSPQSSWHQSASFRFYAELNDFLPADRRAQTFAHRFRGTPSVKDTIEAIGVPHTAIDLVLVDGTPVGFNHLLKGGERVAVYPMFERFDISSESHLRPRPLRQPRFVLDVHLGRLARYLRLLGFDAIYAKDATDAEIASRSVAERRIVLTRDVGLLKRSEVTHGYWVRNEEAQWQLREVVHALDLASAIEPFSRCMVCNGIVDAVDEKQVREALPAGIRGRCSSIARCRECARLYWPGSHSERLRAIVRDVLDSRHGEAFCRHS